MAELETVNDTFAFQNEIVSEIRYADDTTLIASCIESLKIITAELGRACERWGLKINAGKSKVLSPSDEVVSRNNEDLDHVPEFVYLGSVVPGSESDIKRRIATAAVTFGRLRRTV